MDNIAAQSPQDTKAQAPAPQQSLPVQGEKKKRTTMQPRHSQSRTVARPVASETKTGERPTEKPVEFHVNLPHAKSVVVAGTFNDWDTKRTPMRREANGWKATIWLPPGRYEYRFVVDGQWLSDPNARESVTNQYGSTNSVVVV